MKLLSITQMNSIMIPAPLPPLTSVPWTFQGLEVVLVWKMNDVSEEPLSTESLLVLTGSKPEIFGTPRAQPRCIYKCKKICAWKLYVNQGYKCGSRSRGLRVCSALAVLCERRGPAGAEQRSPEAPFEITARSKRCNPHCLLLLTEITLGLWVWS